ncbi:MAG: VWA domain-containing protein [Chloroflexi bacterium]|nr:VWA domain-containing protein [Chloroflexota bacterium]
MPDFSADDVLDALSDDLMAEGDLTEALRRLFTRGLQRRHAEPAEERLAGLRELTDRLAKRRRELLQRYQLGAVLGNVRRELDEIVATERHGIERRLADASSGDEQLRQMLRDMAAKRQAVLDALPPEVGGQIRELQDYDFLDTGARERFHALTERLRRQVMDQYVQGLSEQIKGITPEQLTANRDMVRDLNQLLQERLAGDEPDAAEFLAKHGQFFPGARTLDDVIEQLAQRMAAMQSLLASMSAQQRQELQSMMDALLRDDRLRWDLAQLAANLDQLLPGGLGERLPFRGDEPLSLDGALEQMGRIAEMDHLAERLDDVDDPAGLADVDPDEVRRLLDDDSARDLEALQRLARTLEEAGYAERKGNRLELTPRGTRKIGQGVLDELFARLRRDAFGSHAVDRAGWGGERTDQSIPYEFGRPFHLDLQRTLSNALGRGDNAPAQRGAAPVALSPADFAVYETQQVSDASTVLLVDMSRSMLLRGCFLAAKKVAVALDTLIRTQFPRDDLHVVGFAYYAREIRPGALAGLSWQGYEYGTNLQHGLMLARRILTRSHTANKEVVVITDGEPTAHFEAGQVEFSYPPTNRTIQATLREVTNCTREGITINTFMLERSPALAQFVERMTRLNLGRAFYATPERLGEYILVDYVGRRSRR